MAAAGPEGLVVGVPGHVEALGVLVDLLVAIAGHVPKQHLAALRDRLPVQLDLAPRGPPEVGERGVEAQELLDRAGHKGWIVEQELELVAAASRRPSIPLVNTARVLSLPAAPSSPIPMKISESVSDSPSTSAWTRTLRRSSPGSARRAAIRSIVSSQASRIISTIACSVGPKVLVAEPERDVGLLDVALVVLLRGPDE